MACQLSLPSLHRLLLLLLFQSGTSRRLITIDCNAFLCDLPGGATNIQWVLLIVDYLQLHPTVWCNYLLTSIGSVNETDSLPLVLLSLFVSLLAAARRHSNYTLRNKHENMMRLINRLVQTLQVDATLLVAVHSLLILGTGNSNSLPIRLNRITERPVKLDSTDTCSCRAISC